MASAIAGATATLVVGLTVVTCGPTAAPLPSAQSHGGPATVAGPTAGRGHTDTTSRVKEYKTIAALTVDVPLVAYVTATDHAATIRLHGFPFTTRQVTVNRVVRGSAPSPTIALRELGRPGDDTSLVSGRRYLVFMRPFEMDHGEPTGEWTVAGVYAGLWSISANTSVSANTVSRLDPDSPKLLSKLSVAQMDTQIRSAGR